MAISQKALLMTLSRSEGTGDGRGGMPEFLWKQRAGYRNYRYANVMSDTDGGGVLGDHWHAVALRGDRCVRSHQRLWENRRNWIERKDDNG